MIIKKGCLIIIVAPSGTGKSTLISKIMNEYDDLSWSVSFTTRKIRDGEVDGQDYFFISEEEFQTHKNNNNLVEWANVHGNYYGTSRTGIDEALQKEKTLLFDLDIVGADNIKLIYKKYAHVIFISPPSLKDLESRLKSRGTESDETIAIRLNNAKKEMQRKDDFDYLITNDNLNNAYKELLSIIKNILKR